MERITLGLKGEEFWSEPWKTINDVQMKMIGGRKSGLIVDAPEAVDLVAHDDTPLLIFQSGSAQELASPPLENLAVLVASRVSDRETYVNSAMKHVPSPQAKPSTTWRGRTFQLNLRERLSFPWEPGTFSVRILMRDQSSVALPLELVQSGRYDDPEVKKFMLQFMPPPEPVSPPPGHPFPSYDADESTPAIAKGEEQGIALAVERVIVTTPGRPALLRGSFALKVRRTEIVPPPDPKLPRSNERRPTAILPITLVASGTRDAQPAMLKVRVPSYDEATEDAVVTGAFAIDLLDLGLPSREQTYFIWAFAGDVASTPAVLALLDPKSVPGMRY